MKHILIPTDLTIRSLQPVHQAMHCYPDQLVKITLLHLVDVPDAIGDLLFRLRRMERRYPVPPHFTQACEVMLSKYENRLAQLKPQIQYGTTTAYFRNLMEGMGVEAIFHQRDFVAERPFEDSVDMLPLIRKSGLKLVETIPAKKKNIDAAGISHLLLADN